MSYYEARACLKNKILLGENKIIFFKNINSQEKVDTSYYGINFKNDLTYNIRMNNTQEVKNIINKIFDYLKDNNATVETIYMYSYQLLSTVAEVVIDKRRDTKTYIKQKEKQYRIIMKLESIKAIKEYIIDIFIELTKGYRSSNRNNSDILIYNIKKYIKENYDNPDLKIDNIVNQFNFNYHYLCKLFKQQTKSTIGEYILQVRMRKAKELIFADYTCVETISIKVGYSDANYFSKRFKKYYGISPHKYIKNNRDKRIALQS
jgi:two-component system response regulator YesN